MKIAIAIVLLVAGMVVPRLIGNRDTTTWTLWFLRRLFPAFCFGAALGLIIAAVRGG